MLVMIKRVTTHEPSSSIASANCMEKEIVRVRSPFHAMTTGVEAVYSKRPQVMTRAPEASLRLIVGDGHQLKGEK